MEKSSSLYKIKWNSRTLRDRPATEADRPFTDRSQEWESIYQLRDEIYRDRRHLKHHTVKERPSQKVKRPSHLRWQNQELRSIVSQLKRDK